MHRIVVGDFELTMLSDGPYLVDGGATFGIVPKVLWEKKMKPDELNRITLALNCLLVRTGAHVVLIDTGIGNKLSAKTQQLFGFQPCLLRELQTAGVAPADVDIVINTHLHLDHCGWNTILQDGALVATFPRARYFAQENEVRHARLMHDRDRTIYPAENFDPLLSTGQMELISGDREIIPGVEIKVLPGHTADQQAVILRSQGKVACFVGDLVATSAHLDLVWGMAFDLYPLKLIDSRKWFYERAVAEQWLVAFPHDPNVPWGYLQRGAQGKLTISGQPTAP